MLLAYYAILIIFKQPIFTEDKYPIISSLRSGQARSKDKFLTLKKDRSPFDNYTVVLSVTSPNTTNLTPRTECFSLIGKVYAALLSQSWAALHQAQKNSFYRPRRDIFVILLRLSFSQIDQILRTFRHDLVIGIAELVAACSDVFIAHLVNDDLEWCAPE